MTTPYYSDEFVTLYHGDCREFLPAISATATITDPPYGIGKTYGDSYDDSPGDAYWQMLNEVIGMCRSSSDVVAMTHRVLALRHLDGWDWVGAWTKRNQQMRLFSMPVLPQWEPIITWGLIGHKGPHRPDVFAVDAVPSTSVPGGHPFPKPTKLMADLIVWLTDPGDTVLEPFAGSGTTLRVAKNLARKAIGIEIEERYCEIAAKRLAQGVLDFGGVA